VGEPPKHKDGISDQSDNQVEGNISGDVVQARDVSGGVYFYSQRTDSPRLSIVPRQLPGDVSSFINRRPELRELNRLVTPSSEPSGSPNIASPAVVVVITGSAGVGKTALALHWAHRIRGQFPDGEIYSNLRGYDEGAPLSANVVLDRVLRDLGLPAHLIPVDLDNRAGLFRSLVADRRVLIILDNAATISQVRPLIPGGPGPLLVITSRNRLPGLAIRDGAQRVQLEILQETDAVALLHEITSAGSRRDDPADLIELARLCARLPLALRIAAERAASRPMMQLTELIADLRDDSSLWEALSIGDEREGEAVRTVFAWSYRGLSDEAARMFRVLGLYPGSDISLATAAAIAGMSARAARRALDILLGAFLIETPRPGRYQLHDLLKAYALDQSRMLDSELDRRETLDRLLRRYIQTASNACLLLSPGDRFVVEVEPAEGSDLPPFRDPHEAYEWFESERQNLVASARSAMNSGLYRRAWELAMVLSSIQMQHFTFDDWTAMSEVAVAAAEEIGDPASTASALDNRGKFLFRRGLLDDAKEVHSRALSIREAAGDQRGACESLNALGLIGLRTRDLSEASEYFKTAAEGFQSLRDPRWEGLALSNLAEAQLEAGDARAALDVLLPLPGLFRGLHDPASEGNALWLLSWALRLLEDLASAKSAIADALSIAEDASNRMWEAFWLIEAAQIQLAAGDTGEAMRCCRIAASLERQIGDRSREASALDCTGEVFQAIGNAEEATAFYLQAARMHQELGDAWHEALALAHLASCELALGRNDLGHEHMSLAVSRLQPFSDNRAIQLRQALDSSSN
jgi:tetratricopeptide (TPR) repeat protein